MSSLVHRLFASNAVLVEPQTGAELLRLDDGRHSPNTSALPGVRAWRTYDLVVLSVLFLAAVGIQFTAGAYGGERGNYSDEAGHFLNGLLVRDYVREGIGQNPLEFAEQYYLSYPKIAPGMWPPLFDIAIGVFALPWWPPFTAALLLLACAMSWTAWRLYRIVGNDSPRSIAVAITALFVLTSMIDDMTTAVMLDVVVAALALEATYWLALFFQSERWLHGILYGVFTTLCCLTKGNGLSLVAVPVLLMLFTRRWHLIRHPALYVAAAIVVVFAAPPLAISYRLDAAIGDFRATTIGDVIGRLEFYAEFMREQLGTFALVVPLFAFAGILNPRRSNSSERFTFGPAMLALLIGAVLFHVLNPHVVVAGRYLALAVAPLLALVPQGVRELSSLVPPPWRRTSHGVLLAAVVIAFFIGRPAMASRAPLGFREAAEFLQERGIAGERVLIVSDENGEGAFVSEVAVRHLAPSPTIIRGSKLMATDDWAGHHFRLLFSSPNQLITELEDLHVSYFVLDRSMPRGDVTQYAQQLEEMIAAYPDRLEQVNVVRAGRWLTTYRLKVRSPGPPKPLQVPLTYSLGKTLTR